MHESKQINLIMSIEGNVLANTLANSATENAYQEAQTSRGVLPTYASEDAKAFAGLATNPAENIDPTTAPQAIPSVQSNTATTPGDLILNSIQKISDAQTNSIKNLSDISEKLKDSETVSMAGALEMQKGLMEFQLKQDLISKATGSINQGIQTLFKNQ